MPLIISNPRPLDIEIDQPEELWAREQAEKYEDNRSTYPAAFNAAGNHTEGETEYRKDGEITVHSY